MNKFVLFTGIVIYLLFMTACGKGKGNGESLTPESATEGEHSLGESTEESISDHEASGPDHTLIKTSKQPFSFIIKAGGTILPDSKDIINVTAKTSGIVRLNDHFLFPGVKVRKGTPLFTISGDELTSDNTENELKNAKADYDLAKESFDRAERLIESQLITMDKYLEAKNGFEKAGLRYNNLRSGYSVNGNVVIAPADGYINEVFITEGTKVSSGETMLSVIIEHNLVLQADVSPEHLARMSEVRQANFRLAYSDKVYKTEDMDGKLVSFARSTGSSSYYIPIYFSISFQSEIIPGTYAEVYLKGSPKEDCIVIPNSSILEEFGKYFVFIEDTDGHFEKRYISQRNDRRNQYRGSDRIG